MFELNKNHRSALVAKLMKINEKIELQKSIAEQASKDENRDKDLDGWRDIDMFLLQKQRDIITEALVENEIDF